MSIKAELSKIRPPKEMVITIGVFDGVHLGHQHLLNYLKNKSGSQGLLSGVITFRSHPQTMVTPENRLVWLDSLENRVNLIKEQGIDIVTILDFDSEMMKLSAREFVELLQKFLKMRGLVIGPDFALGKGREGNAQYLSLLGREMGFTVEVVPPFMLDAEKVSSSVVRQALVQGDMNKVSKLLGRHFSLAGLVIPGDKRGRVLGFPTANLEILPEQASPKDGVYVTIARTSNKVLPSVTNIGIRPTFGGEKRLVETYIIDFTGDLEGQDLKIDFISRLRDEMRFDSAGELKIQISKDIMQAKDILHGQVR